MPPDTYSNPEMIGTGSGSVHHGSITAAQFDAPERGHPVVANQRRTGLHIRFVFRLDDTAGRRRQRDGLVMLRDLLRHRNAAECLMLAHDSGHDQLADDGVGHGYATCAPDEIDCRPMMIGDGLSAPDTMASASPQEPMSSA